MLRMTCGVAAVAGHAGRVRCKYPAPLMEVEVAQRVIVTLEDDLGGGPADETIRFAFGGGEDEIDLSSKNATKFRRKLAPFIEHARKAGRGQPRRSRAAAGRQRSGDIRAWAKEHGVAVSERGRIPASGLGPDPAGARCTKPQGLPAGAEGPPLVACQMISAVTIAIHETGAKLRRMSLTGLPVDRSTTVGAIPRRW